MTLGLLAALALVVALFLPVASVDVASGSCEVINDASPDLADRCSLTILERRGTLQGVVWAALLSVAITVMAAGVGLGASRPAAGALIVLGTVVIFFGVVVDLPEASKTGAIGHSFEGAEGVRGPGLYLELVAGALAAAAGLVGLLDRRE